MPPKLKISTKKAAVAAEEAAVALVVAPVTAESKYLASLSPLERRVCAIAESHLESSFDLTRSSGYIAWKAKNVS
jgi:hypothetical protein